MLKMSSQIETIVNAYKTLSKIPTIVGGKLNKSATGVTAKWSVRNLDKGKTTKYLYDYVLDEKLNVIAESEYPTDISNELLSAVSPGGRYKAIIREEKDTKEVKKQYLEVWSRATLAHCVDLTALDLHGDVYADSEFGSLDWSPDESSIVYVAERKLKKSEPYIKRKGEEKPKADGSGEAPPKKGEEYIYRQDWGEQLVGKHFSVVVVCRVETETFTVLDSDVLPDTCCPGQVRFSPNGACVCGVAWHTEPRRLGLIFCTNRPSFIFEVALDGTHKRVVSGEGVAVRSPRYGVDGQLLWLQRAAGGPHHAAHALLRARKDSIETSTVVDVVDTERIIENKDKFYGIYCAALPTRCFANDGRLVFSSSQRNDVRSYVLHLDSGKLVDVSIRNTPGSTTVLDVRNDVILASFSNMTTPSTLYVARLPSAGSETNIQWVPISTPPQVPASVANATVQYMDLEHKDSQDSVKSFSALYFAPNAENKKLPLIVWPHGGPHSSFVNAYAIEAALFNMLGFASLQINYRGSTGAGQASVNFLPKRVGNADVKDCKYATDEAIRMFPIDPKKLCLMGGSHGGFLVAHLSGQYPDTYSVVVSRNPVTDVASMFNSTDIADWCAVEAGFEFTEKGPLSEDQLLAMRRCSPLVHAHKVKAPTCLMLGLADKRVPHYQGLDYARRLKANGVTTRIYMYDDNHSLSSPSVEMDNLINGSSWFLEHLPA